MGKPAQVLTKSIRDYLALKGWLTWKNQSGGFKVEDRYIVGQQAGLPDLMAVKGGRLLCIEVKAGKDRLTAHQTAWLANAQAHGAIVIVAKTVDELIKQVEGLRECLVMPRYANTPSPVCGDCGTPKPGAPRPGAGDQSKRDAVIEAAKDMADYVWDNIIGDDVNRALREEIIANGDRLVKTLAALASTGRVQNRKDDHD